VLVATAAAVVGSDLKLSVDQVAQRTAVLAGAVVLELSLDVVPNFAAALEPAVELVVVVAAAAAAAVAVAVAAALTLAAVEASELSLLNLDSAYSV